ncbi:hypothetical protein JM64_07985 [Fervidobacterium ngatamarikiense]|uniref:DUF4127 family protein n=1 Tax=Fervidobacterium pennivorans TaxID=93466 RepID=A0A172T4J2_FERPE|nr:DUF4127 family protein [Fervidobacterium pennivorans]ANE41891.1 hypothetical protein JM64_07985 [Fervidobacterium pennivorans]
MRVLFLPLDERFCTKDYFIHLCSSVGIDVIFPEHFGLKKTPADVEYLANWLVQNSLGCDFAVLSLDMLLHGGLVPSRLDYTQEETLIKRLNVLSLVKKQNSNLKIYATKTVTRIPTYNSMEEEPDYWVYFGKALYEYSTSLASGHNIKEHNIPQWIIQDFLWRRRRNLQTTKEAINLVKAGVIDFLSIMLDDNSEGSLVYKEACELEQLVAQLGLNEKVQIRNGADEASLSLISKCLCDHFRLQPRFKVIYRKPEHAYLVPPYHSDELDTSTKSHILGAGGHPVDLESEFDILLYVNNFEPDEPKEAPFQNKSIQNLKRTEHAELIEWIDLAYEQNKIIAIADVRYANGSDNSLVERILEKPINWELTTYYGWNTAGNTLGSTCAHSVLLYLSKKGLLQIDREKLEKYQSILLLEHWGYQANVRKMLYEELRRRNQDINSCLSMIKDEEWAKRFVEKNLEVYMDRINQSLKKNWKYSVFFPWHRPFEIGIVLIDTKQVVG